MTYIFLKSLKRRLEAVSKFSRLIQVRPNILHIDFNLSTRGKHKVICYSKLFETRSRYLRQFPKLYRRYVVSTQAMAIAIVNIQGGHSNTNAYKVVTQSWWWLQSNQNKQTNAKKNKGQVSIFSAVIVVILPNQFLKCCSSALPVYCFVIRKYPSARKVPYTCTSGSKINRQNFHIISLSNSCWLKVCIHLDSLQLIYKFYNRFKPTIDCDNSKLDIFLNRLPVKLVILCRICPKSSLT